MFTNDRSHDGNLSLDIVNLRWLLLFFSSGNSESFWTYQNSSSWEDVHMHVRLFTEEVLSEEIVKKDN